MPKKKKISKKILSFFILYEILFISLTAPLAILYGPFKNVKKVIVGTIMGTRHQYLVTTFLSQERIDKIKNGSGIVKENYTNNPQETIDVININHKAGDEIVRFDLHPDSGRYDGYLLEVSPLKIKVAMTQKVGVRGEKTSDMAKFHNAIAAINGGSFIDSSDGSATGTFGGAGASPGGFVISKGKVIYKDCAENVKQHATAFTRKGTLIVGEYSINDLKKFDVTEALCFRDETLILKGKGQIQDAGSDGLNPRTAIGQKADGTVLLLVMDGRKNLIKSGATLKDAQDELLRHGAVTATCLDGGYSSTMYYDGKVISSPHGVTGERYVATALYVEP